MGPSHGREAQLKDDLNKKLSAAMSSSASQLTPEAAMRKITSDMLMNNPFVPPKTGCPVNDLPPELLAYIFLTGTQMEEEYEYSEEDEEEEYLNLKDEWTDDEEDDGDADDIEADGLAKAKAKGKGALQSDAMDVDDDHEDDEDDERDLPFQVLVSHVCKHWRDVAVESPALWTTLTFSEGAPFEKSQIWIQRSKGLPLDIHVDCTIPDPDGDEDRFYDEEHLFQRPFHITHTRAEEEGSSPPLSAAGSATGALAAIARIANIHGRQYAEDHKDCEHPPPPFSLQDLGQILDIIVPHVARWRSLEITCSVYEYMYQLLARLATCAGAPLLEVLELYHYEDCEDYEEFRPVELREPFLLFHGNAPLLRDVALWGVHLDWDGSLGFLRGLRDLELTYHAKDVRPSYAAFTSIIAASPELRTLSLCLSGPQEHVASDPAASTITTIANTNRNPNDWGRPDDPISIPSLKDLVLCYHEAAYAVALLQKLHVPNVHSLALDFDGEDYSAFVRQLTRPMPVPADTTTTKASILAGLQHLKISGLPCDARSIDAMYEQLGGLQTINLNCSGENEEQLFRRLHNTKPSTASSQSKIVCPKLHTITTTGISGAEVRAFVEARRAAGVPIRRVMVSEEDHVDEKDEKWLRAHVEEFEFFEPSDEEEEFVDEDESGDEEMGG